MCGIAGWFGNIPSDSRGSLIENMNESIIHRGPDARSNYSDNNVGIGFNRLSIINPKNGAQPVWSDNGRYVAVANGEIYNYKLLEKLLSQRFGIRSEGSDISVIPHLFQTYGLGSLSLLNGMYSLALWDKDTRTGYLHRDPAGIKPLYYAQYEGRTYFASEIKALAAAGLPMIPDTEQLKNVLLYRSSEIDKTCFQNVFKVPPGKTISISSGQVISVIDIPHYKSNFSNVDLEALLEETVKTHLMSDVPIGVFLSGGVDSGLIAAMASNIVKDKIKSFTVGFNSSYDERLMARSISDHIGSEHTEINVSFAEMSSHFNRVVWHMDEPILDPSFFPSYFLAKGASESVKVVLSGEGADEVFAGYDKHVELLNQTQKHKEMNGCSREIAMSYISKRMPFDFKTAASLGLEISTSVNNLVHSLENTFPEKLLRAALDIDRKAMLPSLQLMRVDKATMAHGLEARVPFLDRNVIAAAQSMDANQFISEGYSKVFLREVARNYLPNSITDVPKRVFYVPLDEWISGDTRKDFEEIIRESTIISELVDKKQLVENISELNSYQIWSLRVLESWHENNILGSGLKPSVS